MSKLGVQDKEETIILPQLREVPLLLVSLLLHLKIADQKVVTLMKLMK